MPDEIPVSDARAQGQEHRDLRQRLSARLGLIMAVPKSIVNDCPTILSYAEAAPNRVEILP